MTRIRSDRMIVLGVVICFFTVAPISAFVTKASPFVAKGSDRSYSPSESSSSSRRERRVWKFEAVPPNQEEDATTADMNPVTRASWYAVEAFGTIFGNRNDSSPTIAGGDIDLTKAPVSLEETLRRIQLDNDRSYFLSGNVDVLTYDPDCIFSDPFVAFAGRDRFVDNLANLGSFITEYDAKMLGYNVEDEGETVQTKVMVKLELNLPWKPILAWPWGVRYSLDPDSYLITNHAESWDIDPWEGVKQIFRKPTLRIKGKKEE
eukprot:scaffold22474_cov49-Attheya_sp.AAC.2